MTRFEDGFFPPAISRHLTVLFSVSYSFSDELGDSDYTLKLSILKRANLIVAIIITEKMFRKQIKMLGKRYQTPKKCTFSEIREAEADNVFQGVNADQWKVSEEYFHEYMTSGEKGSVGRQFVQKCDDAVDNSLNESMEKDARKKERRYRL